MVNTVHEGSLVPVDVVYQSHSRIWLLGWQTGQLTLLCSRTFGPTSPHGAWDRSPMGIRKPPGLNPLSALQLQAAVLSDGAHQVPHRCPRGHLSTVPCSCPLCPQ